MFPCWDGCECDITFDCNHFDLHGIIRLLSHVPVRLCQSAGVRAGVCTEQHHGGTRSSQTCRSHGLIDFHPTVHIVIFLEAVMHP